MKLQGKVAIITGGAYGIGKAFATRFVSEGASVAVADINLAAATATVEALRAKGGEALAIRTDVSQIEQAQDMAKKTKEHFGRIDILISNAAILGRIRAERASFWDITVEQWDRIMAVNLRGTFLCCQAVFPYMKAQGGGKIITIASGTALSGAPLFAHYVASKGGVLALTKSLALELGEYSINVNCIAPGHTFSGDPSNRAALENCQRAAAVRAIKRVEYPDDLTGTAVFLASSDSDFITGETIAVDGGRVMR